MPDDTYEELAYFLGHMPEREHRAAERMMGLR
jgi:hypothetical protein